jgi:hypothetical protein
MPEILQERGAMLDELGEIRRQLALLTEKSNTPIYISPTKTKKKNTGTIPKTHAKRPTPKVKTFCSPKTFLSPASNPSVTKRLRVKNPPVNTLPAPI